METELFHFAGKESFPLKGSNQAQNIPLHYALLPFRYSTEIVHIAIK